MVPRNSLGGFKILQGGQFYKKFFKSCIFSYILPIFLIPRGGHDPPWPPLGPSLPVEEINFSEKKNNSSGYRLDLKINSILDEHNMQEKCSFIIKIFIYHYYYEKYWAFIDNLIFWESWAVEIDAVEKNKSNSGIQSSGEKLSQWRKITL